MSENDLREAKQIREELCSQDLRKDKQLREELCSQDLRKEKWPWWVRLGLWKVPTRIAAWTYFWICIASTAVMNIIGLFIPIFLIGGLFIFAALHYYLCIRWVDKNSHWSAK